MQTHTLTYSYALLEFLLYQYAERQFPSFVAPPLVSVGFNLRQLRVLI